MNISKICSKCSTEKDLTEFYSTPQGRLGVQADCKECRRKSVRAYRKTARGREVRKKWEQSPSSKEKMKKYQKEYRMRPDVQNRTKEYRRRPDVREKCRRSLDRIKSLPEWKDRRHKYELKARYNMSLADYERLVQQQQSKCAICEQTLSKHRYFNVDHCHKTKVIRGLLCPDCNRGIGLFKDNPSCLRKAASYLETCYLVKEGAPDGKKSTQSICGLSDDAASAQMERSQVQALREEGEEGFA